MTDGHQQDGVVGHPGPEQFPCQGTYTAAGKQQFMKLTWRMKWGPRDLLVVLFCILELIFKSSPPDYDGALTSGAQRLLSCSVMPPVWFLATTFTGIPSPQFLVSLLLFSMDIASVKTSYLLYKTIVVAFSSPYPMFRTPCLVSLASP